ncbi:MAG: uracil-DNA glycosylase family protein [Pseudomonadota bacterium]
MPVVGHYEGNDSLAGLATEMNVCRICVNTPLRKALPHEPRPVAQLSSTARICLAGQAPGARVNASGRPFTDPSGDRLRAWLGMEEAAFYDARQLAIVPMGFCFPGLDAKGSDLPPRRECARQWHDEVFAQMPQLGLIVAIGAYAQDYHLGKRRCTSVTETVANWRVLSAVPGRLGIRVWPVPHPSWRNTAWLKKHPWFEDEALPALKAEIRNLRSPAP